MTRLSSENITQSVINRLEGCADPRLRTVMAALVRYLHAFVNEVRPTDAEWMQGIEFLTATGQKCDANRQEFILLSDVLGASMLTVALNEPARDEGTEATVFGPFHVDDAPTVADGEDLSAGAPGEPLWCEIEVVDTEGQPVAGAQVDVWQADAEGLYDVQRPELGDARRARGVLKTDDQGRLRFRSVLPTAYPVPTDGPVGRLLQATGRHPWRPAHIHFRLRAPGHRTLVTHLFVQGDAFLDSDVVFGVRPTLVCAFERRPASREMPMPHHGLRHRFVLVRQAD